MVWENTRFRNMRPNRLSHIYKSLLNTVLFVNATIGFSENLFLVLILSRLSDSAPGKRGSYFQAQALYLSLRTS